MSTLPGWRIHVPGTPDETERALLEAHGSDESHYIRLADDMNGRTHELETGRIATLRRGSDQAPTVLAVGPVADDVLTATDGRDVTVLYTTVPHPIDARGLRASVIGTDLVIVEPYLAGTTTHDVTAAIDRPMRVRSIGVTDPELERYGTRSELKAAHGLDVDGIKQTLDQVLQPA